MKSVYTDIFQNIEIKIDEISRSIVTCIPRVHYLSYSGDMAKLRTKCSDGKDPFSIFKQVQ